MRILLADDQAEVRSALKLLLEQEDSFEVVAEAVEADDLVPAVLQCCPDLVLLDWELPGLAHCRSCEEGAIGVLQSLRLLLPGLAIVAMSGRPGVSQVALEAHANAFVSKGDPPERLLAALRGLKGD